MENSTAAQSPQLTEIMLDHTTTPEGRALAKIELRVQDLTNAIGMLELIAGGLPNDNYDDTIKTWTVRRGVAGLVSSFRAIEDDLYSLVNEGCHLHPTQDERAESKANNTTCGGIDKPTIDMDALRKELIDESREVEKKTGAVCNMLSLCGAAQYPDTLSQCDISQVFDCLFALVDDVYDVASKLTLHIDNAFDTIQGRTV